MGRPERPLDRDFPSNSVPKPESNEMKAAVMAVLMAGVGSVMAAAPPAGAPTGTPRDFPQFEVTGTWVPLITEDWLYRMVIPKAGDFGSGIPLNPEGRRVAEAWSNTAEAQWPGSCKAYGAPSGMRMPGRVRISWEDARTLKLDFAAGQQTRRFHFADNLPPQGFVATDPPHSFGRSPAATGGRSLQGHSVAAWHKQAQTAGLGFMPPGTEGPRTGGSLVVATQSLQAGYLQPNGVPYSQEAELTEYITAFKLPDGTDGLVVTAVLEDSTNLNVPFVRSTHFKREPNDSKWEPYPCVGG